MEGRACLLVLLFDDRMVGEGGGAGWGGGSGREGGGWLEGGATGVGVSARGR